MPSHPTWTSILLHHYALHRETLDRFDARRLVGVERQKRVMQDEMQDLGELLDKMEPMHKTLLEEGFLQELARLLVQVKFHVRCFQRISEKRNRRIAPVDAEAILEEVYEAIRRFSELAEPPAALLAPAVLSGKSRLFDLLSLA